MASDILIVRKETRCRHIGYSFRLAARVILYAPPHRQDSTYHGLCYTSRGALAGTRNNSIDPTTHRTMSERSTSELRPAPLLTMIVELRSLCGTTPWSVPTFSVVSVLFWTTPSMRCQTAGGCILLLLRSRICRLVLCCNACFIATHPSKPNPFQARFIFLRLEFSCSDQSIHAMLAIKA